jgi:hypothetical protein
LKKRRIDAFMVGLAVIAIIGAGICTLLGLYFTGELLAGKLWDIVGKEKFGQPYVGICRPSPEMQRLGPVMLFPATVILFLVYDNRKLRERIKRLRRPR